MLNGTGGRTVTHAASAALLASGAAAVVPSVAFAATAASGPIDIALGVLMLAAAVFLLVVAYGLENVAAGSAMADNMRWVMLAAICIASNVLIVWVARFVSDPISTTVMSLAADGLMILGIVFLCAYFYRVRAAMLRFMDYAAASTEDVLAQVQADDPQGLPGPSAVDAPESVEPAVSPSEPSAPDETP